MRKSFSLIIICCILGTVTYFSWLRKDNSLRKNETRFRLSNPEAVTEVHINTVSDTIVLIRSGDTWEIAQEQADAVKINDLLVLASQMYAVAPAPLNIKDSLNQAMKNGLEILYKIQRKSTLSYALCRIDNQIYAQLKNSKNAYRIAFKGYPNVDLLQVFKPIPERWKSSTIIDLDPESIKSVTLTYPEHPEESFHIIRSEDRNILLLETQCMDTIENVNSDLLFEYFFFFRDIKQMPFHDQQTGKEFDLMNTKPFFSLAVYTFTGDTLSIIGYRKQESKTGGTDLNYFYGMVHGNDLIMLKYIDFDAILVSIDYFRKK